MLSTIRTVHRHGNLRTWLSPKRAWQALRDKPLGCCWGCTRNYVAVKCRLHGHLVAHLIGGR